MQKTLKRIPEKGMIAGVIAGCAEYFAVDVTMLRIVFVLFVLATGFFPGVVAYIIAILIMPIDTIVIHEVRNDSNEGASR
jgi:phage shock protein PspC (stress-responsive transcriptional regulator)